MPPMMRRILRPGVRREEASRVSRWMIAAAALLAALLAAWTLLRGPEPGPHADIEEADRQRLLEILRQEAPSEPSAAEEEERR